MKAFTVINQPRAQGCTTTVRVAWGVANLFQVIEEVGEFPDQERCKRSLWNQFRDMNNDDTTSWNVGSWRDGYDLRVTCHGEFPTNPPEDTDDDRPDWEPPHGIEVFYRSTGENQIEEWADRDGNVIPGGWFWWSCQPGCLPDTDAETAAEAANGPFETYELACKDAWNE